MCSVSEAHVQVSTWSAHVPGTVMALQGSCVVIPCTFTYPGRERKQSDLTAMWHTKDHAFIYHPDIGEVLYRFRGRTSLVGDLGRKNCSLKIDRVQRIDGGPFIFRLAIDDGEKFSYTKSEVSIVVKDRPDVPLLTVGEPVKVGETVSASCSVYHSCPSNPPLLSWNHVGTHSVHSEKLPGGQWRMVSVLLFTSSVSDHKKPLTCTTKYWEGKTVRSSRALNVKLAQWHNGLGQGLLATTPLRTSGCRRVCVCKDHS
uniref:Ig-like domain-containing protein n=1 Tax=Scleropages formosus TaxID=113540 RepID=A0A8C9THH6_SCLFO